MVEIARTMRNYPALVDGMGRSRAQYLYMSHENSISIDASIDKIDQNRSQEASSGN